MEAAIDTVLQKDLDEIAGSFLFTDELKNKTVLVTGATGLIGSFTVKALACINRVRNAGMKIIAHVRNSEKASAVLGELLQRDDISLLCCDIEKMPADVKTDYIIHTASVTSSKYFVTNPVQTITSAFNGTASVLELARNCGAKGVVYLSSMEVYGITDSSLERVAEKDLGYIDVLNVRSCYSEGKRCCEALCAFYAHQYGVPVKIARLAQTFGAGVSFADTRAFAQFAKSSLAGEDIILHTAGKSMGNYCYTADAFRGIFTVLFKGECGQAYTVANESASMTISEMAHTAASVLSEGKSHLVFDIPESALVYGYAPDVTMKLTSEKLRALGWEPKVDLEEMFVRLAASWRANGNI